MFSFLHKAFGTDWHQQLTRTLNDIKWLDLSFMIPFLLTFFSVTMENVARFKGQEYCLHPKLQSTKNLVKWFRIWKDKHR